MKDIVNNKKGFTLTEILVVIVLVGGVLMLVIPNVVKMFSQSVTGTMQVQESEMETAALFYLEDHCKNPLKNYKCTLTKNSDLTYSGTIQLSTLVSENYIDTVKLENDICTGYVRVTNNKVKAYLSCGNNGERYKTSGY